MLTVLLSLLKTEAVAQDIQEDTRIAEAYEGFAQEMGEASITQHAQSATWEWLHLQDLQDAISRILQTRNTLRVLDAETRAWGKRQSGWGTLSFFAAGLSALAGYSADAERFLGTAFHHADQAMIAGGVVGAGRPILDQEWIRLVDNINRLQTATGVSVDSMDIEAAYLSEALLGRLNSLHGGKISFKSQDRGTFGGRKPSAEKHAATLEVISLADTLRHNPTKALSQAEQKEWFTVKNMPAHTRAEAEVRLLADALTDHFKNKANQYAREAGYTSAATVVSHTPDIQVAGVALLYKGVQMIAFHDLSGLDDGTDRLVEEVLRVAEATLIRTQRLEQYVWGMVEEASGVARWEIAQAESINQMVLHVNAQGLDEGGLVNSQLQILLGGQEDRVNRAEHRHGRWARVEQEMSRIGYEVSNIVGLLRLIVTRNRLPMSLQPVGELTDMADRVGRVHVESMRIAEQITRLR